jgi:FixJ family two-component response regulator
VFFEGTGKDKSLNKGSDDLTERQIEILALIAVRATNEDIADRLCVSHHTVKPHLIKSSRKSTFPIVSGQHFGLLRIYNPCTLHCRQVLF